MNLEEILIPTEVAHAGMSFGDALAECVKQNVPGIPFVDGEGKIVGRFSLRHAFRLTCVPRDYIQGAHLLGDDLDYMDMAEEKAEMILPQPVEGYVLEDAIQLNPGAQVMKALAIMEQFNTGYLFLTDGDEYKGVITRVGIARLVLNLGCC